MEKDISNTTQELKNINDELKEAQENVDRLNNTPVEVQVKGEEDVAGLKDVLQDLMDQSGDAVEAFADFAGIEISDEKMETVRDLAGAVGGLFDPAKWSSPLAMLKDGIAALSSASKLFGDETTEKMQGVQQAIRDTADEFQQAKESVA